MFTRYVIKNIKSPVSVQRSSFFDTRYLVRAGTKSAAIVPEFLVIMSAAAITGGRTLGLLRLQTVAPSRLPVGNPNLNPIADIDEHKNKIIQ